MEEAKSAEGTAEELTPIDPTNMPLLYGPERGVEQKQTPKCDSALRADAILPIKTIHRTRTGAAKHLPQRRFQK